LVLKYWTGRTLLDWTIYITKSHPALCRLCQFLSKSACSCCFFTRSLLSKVRHDRFDRAGDVRSRVSFLHEMSVFDSVIRRGRSEKGWRLRALHRPWLVLDGMLVVAWVTLSGRAMRALCRDASDSKIALECARSAVQTS